MNRKSRILIIDDEPEMLEVLQFMLAAEGFETVTARDALSGIRAAYHVQPDAILLDVMMPHIDGFETCRRLRQMTTVPILILTGAATTAENISQGFSAGADEYVTKPFHRSELISRLMACLRRAGQRDDRANRVRTRKGFADGKYLSPAPSIILDCDRRELMVENRSVYLSPNEFKVLELLMRHPGRTLSRDAILTQVWGPERIGELGTVKQYIHQLRKKIEPDPDSPRYILSDWGEGYYFQIPDRGGNLG